MKTIGKIKLQNNGGFVAKLEFEYYNEQTNKWIRTGGTGNITLGFSNTAVPGDYGVPDGSMVRLHVNVVCGSDNVSNEMFLFEKDRSFTACYAISGTTFHNHLEFTGIMEAPMMTAGVENMPQPVSADDLFDVESLSPEGIAELQQNLENPSFSQSGSYGPLGWNVMLDIHSTDILKSKIDVKISLLGANIMDVRLDAQNPKATVDLSARGQGMTADLGANFDKRIVYLKGTMKLAGCSKKFDLTILSF